MCDNLTFRMKVVFGFATVFAVVLALAGAMMFKMQDARNGVR